MKKRSKKKPAGWTTHLPNDHKHVTLLLNEAERLTALGAKWAAAKPTNPIAVDSCFRGSWAHNLSACWLRCKLKGELEK